MNMKLSFLPALALLFIGLKLGGVISWSWWWVLCPLYGPLAIAVGFFMATLFTLCLVRTVVHRKEQP